MANYDVSIKLAVAGAKELDRVNKKTEQLRKNIDFINNKAQKGTAGMPVVKNFKNLSKAVNEARDALDNAAIGTKEYNQALKNLVTVENKLNRAQKNKIRDLKVEKIRRKEGITLQQAKNKVSQQELELENRLANAKARTARAERNKRIGGTISSAAIGGAFPLLFGQTGAAAIGGGVGGAAGGLIGGQFGFALSILGTAIGSAVDKAEKFNQSLVQLNTRMGTTGSETAITAKEVNSLAKSLNITKEEVFGVLGAFREFGNGEIAKSMAVIFGSDAGGVDRFAKLNRSAKMAQEIFDARKQIGNEAAKDLLIQNKSVDIAVIELALVKAKAKAEQDAAIARVKAVSAFDQFRANTPGMLALRLAGKMKITDYGDIRAQNLQKQFDEENLTLIENYKKGMIEARELLELLRESQGEFGISGVDNFNAITDKVKDLQDEMLKLQNPIFQFMSLSQTMAQSFQSSFEGIIRGTMSINDAFRNMFNAIVDHFIKSAAQMAANQFQQGLLGMFGKMFGGGRTGTSRMTGLFGGGFMQGPQGGYYDSVTGKGIAGPNFGLANGGTARAGSTYMVGERGPELFSPGVTGTVTPNHALGGSTNIVVNVDASGSSVEGDEEQGRELGRLISVAIQSELVQQKRPGGLLA